MAKTKLKFIDLFAGLGGFHLALSDLGHKCVFASELNEELRELYVKNYKTKIEGDINEVDINSIPAHDVLCAGFPCQPFSKAGAQLGLNDPANGNLFYKIVEILEKHKPEYVFLENVPNLRGIWSRLLYGRSPIGSSFPLQSFCTFITKRISTAISNAKILSNKL